MVGTCNTTDSEAIRYPVHVVEVRVLDPDPHSSRCRRLVPTQAAFFPDLIKLKNEKILNKFFEETKIINLKNKFQFDERSCTRIRIEPMKVRNTGTSRYRLK